MDKLINKIAILSCLCLVMQIPLIAEGSVNSRHFKAANQVLSYSLDSLKDSAQSVANRNQELYVEISSMEQEIQGLKSQLSQMEQQKRILLNDTFLSKEYIVGENTQHTYVEKNYDRLEYEFIQLDEDVSILENQKREKEKKIEELQTSVKAMDNEVLQLKQGIDSVGDLTSLIRNNPRLFELYEQKKYLKKKLESADREHQKLTKKYAKPLKELFEERDTNKQLSQQLAIVNDEMRILLEKEKNLTYEIDNVASTKEHRLRNIKEEIAQLQQKEKEISQVLSKAEKKVGHADISSEEEKNEIDSLTQNLATIEKENELLKKKLSKLKNVMAKN